MTINAITWFEIPAIDFDRAVAFYDAVLDATLRKDVPNGLPHGFFPADEAGVGGAVVKGNGGPSASGPLLYLNATSEAGMDAIIARVPAHGGTVIAPKLSIPPHGFMAIILDTEGNRIAFHAPAAQ